MHHTLSRGTRLALLVLCTSCADHAAAPSAARLDPSLARADGPTVLHVSTTPAPVLTTAGDVTVYKSGHGSAMALVPGFSRHFYLLTDRGPNIDGATSDIKLFPDPTYAPRVYRAHVAGSRLRLDGEIVLRRADGTPITGIPIPVGQCGSTAEIARTLDGVAIPADPHGLDPEGIVVMADGSFWVSDEYGPFLAHFAADGRELQRLTPCNGGLPEVYKLRRPNRGMEGLTITPDGEWLVGIMQAPLENPSRTGVRNTSRATRILFRHLGTGQTREYVYLLDSPTLQGNSEILALSATRFLVIERDGAFLHGSPPATTKRIYEIDVTGATDVSALGALGAKPVSGTKTIEQARVSELAAAGIVPVRKALAVDLLALGYPNDKPEGLAVAPGGMLFVVNDDDFGVSQSGGTLVQKLLPPTDAADAVSIWQVRMPK